MTKVHQLFPMDHMHCRQVCSPECDRKLELGDTVSLNWEDGYDSATVCQLHEDGTIDLFRPYTHTADFSYTGGVICYVGFETIKHADPARFTLLRKGRPLK